MWFDSSCDVRHERVCICRLISRYLLSTLMLVGYKQENKASGAFVYLTIYQRLWEDTKTVLSGSLEYSLLPLTFLIFYEMNAFTDSLSIFFCKYEVVVYWVCHIINEQANIDSVCLCRTMLFLMTSSKSSCPTRYSYKNSVRWKTLHVKRTTLRENFIGYVSLRSFFKSSFLTTRIWDKGVLLYLSSTLRPS